MTTCFVVQFGPMCLAAADTRFTAAGSTGLPPEHWDAADLPVITESGAEHVLPYRFRKIRQLDRGWAVLAGCFVTGKRMLDLLSRQRAHSSQSAAQVLREGAAAELEALEADPDAGQGLYSSRLLGVPASSERQGVWVAHLDRSDGYTVAAMPSFAMNWPASIAPAVQQAAEQAFFAQLDSMTHLASAVRAAAVLIGAARSAFDSSAVVQIGLTWQKSPTEFQSRYLQGHADDIARMSDEEVLANWEVLET